MRNKAIVRRYFDAKWNERNPEVVAELLTPDVTMHGPAVELSGLDEYRRVYAGLLDALADTKVTMEDLVEEGDKVVSRIVLYGVHSGDLLGIPATGKSFRLTVVTIFSIENGKIADEYQTYDALDLLTQLGMAVGPA